MEANTLRQTKVIFVNGEEVKILRITPRTLQPTINYVSDVLASLSVVEGAPTINLLDPVVILNLISKNLEGSLAVISRLSSLQKEELLDSDLDVVVKVAIAIIEENYRFFTEKVLPLLQDAEKAIPQLDSKKA